MTLTLCVLIESVNALTFVVNSTGDESDALAGDGLCQTPSGTCTLRAAIQEANASSGLDQIHFSIGTGVQMISPTTNLPTITDFIVVDATTQPGFSGMPLIDLDGTQDTTTPPAGIHITAGGSAVYGVVITGFDGDGIWLELGGRNIIAGNFIGTDPTGTLPRGNRFGIHLDRSNNNTVGGMNHGDMNLISGNRPHPAPGFGTAGGISISKSIGNKIVGNFIGTDITGTISLSNFEGIVGSNMTGTVIGGNSPEARNLISGNFEGMRLIGPLQNNRISGNFFGTDVTGTSALRNSSNGIYVAAGAGGPNNVIGGTTPGERNIFGASNECIDLGGSDNSFKIIGNYIGTDVTGTVSLGVTFGIQLNGSTRVQVGGPNFGERNLISGNPSGGIQITNDGDFSVSSHHIIQGNWIGLQADGVSPLPNGLGSTDPNGEFIRAGGYGVLVQTSENQIGGYGAGEQNVIAYNDGGGIYVALASQKNSVLLNIIHDNGGLGINLEGAGGVNDQVTPNDVGDADTGGNALLNFPVLVSAVRSGTTFTISGTLNSLPNAVYQILFYLNPMCDPAGYGEGRFFLGSAAAATNAMGNANFASECSFLSSGFITAVTIDGFGNTSEFSACLPVLDPDTDGDGIRDDVEDGAAGGDGNHDGIPDRLQVNVVSFPNAVDGAYVTLAAEAGLSFSEVRVVAPAALDVLHLPAQLPFGVWEYKLGGLTPGSTTTVSIFTAGSRDVNNYFKFGPEVGDLPPHWHNLVFDGQSGFFSSSPVITVRLTEGARGDDDRVPNGVIIDRGGLVFMPVAAVGWKAYE